MKRCAGSRWESGWAGSAGRLLGSIAFAASLGIVAWAGPAWYDLDPERSVVSLSGTISALGLEVPMEPQAPGSLTASFGGSLRVEQGDGRLSFLPGGQVVPRENGSWEPGLGGVAGRAPASYAGKARIQVLFFTASAVAASRAVSMGLTSPPLTVGADGTFPAGSLQVTFLEGASSALDFRITGAVEQSGTRLLTGLLTNRVSTVGRRSTNNGVETLTVPVDAGYTFQVESDVGPTEFRMRFVGQLVATRREEVEEPVVVLQPPTAPGEPLTLAWPAAFKLQRATQLLPPNWVDDPSSSPLTVPTTQPGEFFRVIPR